jgi:thiamine kinase-like enzyme
MDIGPNLIYHDPEDQLLLLEKAHGNHLSLAQLTEAEVQIAIASQLSTWHQANPDNISAKPSLIEKINKLAGSHNELILKGLGISNINELTQPWSHHLSTTHTVCHGDPNPSNIILLPSGTVHLIDWSAAGIGEPWADFAMISQYLPPAKQRFWYELITEHHGNQQTKQTFEAYQHLLHVHCCFWALSQAKSLLASNQESLEELIANQELTCNIPTLQANWLNGNFEHKNPAQYVLLAKLMLDFCLTSQPS